MKSAVNCFNCVLLQINYHEYTEGMNLQQKCFNPCFPAAAKTNYGASYVTIKGNISHLPLNVLEALACTESVMTVYGDPFQLNQSEV